MTDIEFDDGRDRGYGADGVEAETVSGMAFKTQIMGMLGGAPEPVELILAGVVRGFAVGAGMKFDHRRSERVRGIQLTSLGLDEQGDANSRRAQLIDSVRATAAIT